MTACPPDDVLGALVRRTLDERAAAEVTSHLDECASCREIVVAAVRGGLAAGTPTEPTSEPGPRAAPVDRAVDRAVDREIGARIGRYEIRGLLGAGGMGRVYEAFDPELDRAVALKLVRPELGLTSLFAERLVRESRLAAKVVHPAVITVHDAGRYGDAVFIAMDLVRGETLGAYVARARPGWRAILGLFERAGQGLAAAHAAGIVHRDFKPDNVLVEGDGARIVVTDFGVGSVWKGQARDPKKPPGKKRPEQKAGGPPLLGL
ncbi:MAG: protein kinase domain-containing protein, partial [Kofleriaceae bacterium]